MKKIILLFCVNFALFGSVLDDAVREYKSKNYNRAFEILDLYKNQNDNSQLYNYYLCKSAYLLKKYESSLEACRRALEINPNNQYAKYGIGLAKMGLKKYEDAKMDFESLLNVPNLNPKIKPYVYKKVHVINQILKTKKVHVTKKPKFSKKNEDEVFKTAEIKSSDALNEAKKEYEKGDFEKTFAILNKYKWENFSNEEYNYYLCKSSYSVKNYKVSLSACERIVHNNPDNQYARYGLGLAQLELHMYEDAKNEFEFLLKSKNLNPSLRMSVNKKLALANEALSGGKLSVTVGAGIFYNSNVDSTSDKKSVKIPIFDKKMETGDKKGDFYHQELAQINYLKKIKRTDWIFNNNLHVANQNYFKEKGRNILYFAYEPSLAYISDDYSFALALNGSKFYRDFDEYLKMISINPSFSAMLSPSLRLNLQAMAARKMYYGDFKDYNADAYEGQAGVEYFMSNMSWLLNMAYGGERKKKDVRNDVSYDYYSGGLALYTPIFKKMALRLESNYKQKNYKDTNEYFLSKREDEIYNGTLALIYNFTDSWLLNMSYDFKYNKSNQNLYDYKQHLVGFNVYKTFEF